MFSVNVTMSFLLRIPFLLLFVVKALAQAGPSQWNPSPFNPPALPLAVKSPYLNAWMPQGNNPPELSSFWPQLWTINNVSFPSLKLKGNRGFGENDSFEKSCQWEEVTE